jgi:hypothetical protein
MFNELSGLVQGALQKSDPTAVSDAARQQVAEMPPAEVAQHAQTAVSNLQEQGQPDLAKELGDVIQSAQTDPNAVKNAVIAFIEHHPQALAAFAPSFAQGVLAKL